MVGSPPWTWQDKGGALDAQDGRGSACALGRGSPHRRPAHPSYRVGDAGKSVKQKNKIKMQLGDGYANLRNSPRRAVLTPCDFDLTAIFLRGSAAAAALLRCSVNRQTNRAVRSLFAIQSNDSLYMPILRLRVSSLVVYILARIPTGALSKLRKSHLPNYLELAV